MDSSASSSQSPKDDVPESLPPGPSFLASLLRPWFLILKITGFHPLSSTGKFSFVSPPYQRLLRIILDILGLLWSSVFVIGVVLLFSVTVIPAVIKSQSNSTSDMVRQACRITIHIVLLIGIPYYIHLFRGLHLFLLQSHHFTSTYLNPPERRRFQRVLLALSIVQTAITITRVVDAIYIPVKQMENDFVTNLLSVCGDSSYTGLRALARGIFIIDQINQCSLFISHSCFIVIWLVLGVCYTHLSDRMRAGGGEEVDRLLEEHANLNALVLSLEHKITYLTLALYVNDLVCLLYFIGCHKEDRMNPEYIAYVPNITASLVIFAFMVMRTFALIYTSEQANSAVPVMHTVARTEMSATRRMDLFMQLYQMETTPMTFSLGGIIATNRTFILSVVGLILTYAVVILQLDQKDSPDLNTTEWKNLFKDALSASRRNITELIIQQNISMYVYL
ncbi:uncharacterized protein LOC129582405 [Paramacrobiotus metropolitanus]|uniref:uncharacterized protein LOC129582405 n=1 Tax=Paramacrobiotus metropolitanus TaxID=2943436 RepID=UPI002445DC6D|nr:uncharacterized protein LOC129582405 [Paramacrobiotus metropolitanus]